jgi:CRISPR-associated protein Cas5h
MFSRKNEEYVMEILAFNIKGKFAHFRKFYSNSSALSYFIPPRTTIIGIIAGILGLERDSYYEDFSLDNCDIGIRTLSRIKKSIQRLKYLKVESPNDLNGSYFDKNQKMYTANTMVPFEFLLPQNIRKKDSFVSYRFYYHSKTDKNSQGFNQLVQQLKDYAKYHYPISFGTANFSAFIDNFTLYESKSVETIESDDCACIDSAIPLSCIKEFPIDKNYHIIQETLPMDFSRDRYLKKHSEIIFNLNCEPLNVKLNSNYYSLNKNDQKENILFLK